MDRVLNIGMIGCGEISLANLKGIQNSGVARVIIAMDPIHEMARSFAQTAGAQSTTRVEDVFEADDVDAVFICTPHHLHAPLGIQSAKKGKHVIVEKPMATTLEAAQELIEVCRFNRVKLTVPYVFRYHQVVKKARDMIRQKTIGNIAGLEIRWISDKPESYWESGFSGRVQTEWRKSKTSSGGGILIMNCIHLFDIVEFITGLRPVKYFSQYDTYMTSVEVEDYFYGILRYDNGAIGNIMASSKIIGGRYPGEQRGIRLFGEYGQIVIGLPDSLTVYTNRTFQNINPNEWHEILLTTDNKPERVDQTKKHPRTLFIKDFAEAVFEDREPTISGSIAYRSLETVIRLYESSGKNAEEEMV